MVYEFKTLNPFVASSILARPTIHTLRTNDG